MVTLAATGLPEIETTELSKAQPEEAVAAPPDPELLTEKLTEVAATTEEPAAAPEAEAPAVEAKIKEVVEEPEVAAEEAAEATDAVPAEEPVFEEKKPSEVTVKKSDGSWQQEMWQRSEGMCRGPAGGQGEVAARR